MSKVTPTSQRKADHIRINLDEDVRSSSRSGLGRFSFPHQALPELDLKQIDLSLSFLGKRLQAPLLISSMTGGTPQAGSLNRILAAAAQETGIAMGLGSMRAAIENPSLASTFQVRNEAPDILLFANLGVVQFNYGYSVEQCLRAVELVEADGLVLHCNPLQEALQPEGDVNFAGLLPKIEEVCRSLPVPVIVKEVGWGISGALARDLVNAGVAAIDVAGAGGTSWSQVEMHRAQDERQAQLAALFSDWGIPTAECLRQVRSHLPAIPLIASGGVYNGVDIAKCIALGADLGAMASPFLKAAAVSLQAVIDLIEDTQRAISLCMFATGSPDLPSLRKVTLVTA